MNFDFNLILVPLTLVLLLLWLLDKVFFKQRKTRGKGKENFAIRNAYEFLPVLAILLIVRSFIIEPFVIPSSSMVPTLYTGDFIAVNKMAYGLRLPLSHLKIMQTGHPQHGDVVVFRYPKDPKTYYVKRMIGLPGDTVAYQEGVLSINGQPVATLPANYMPDAQLTTQLITAGAMPDGEVLSAQQAALLGQEEENHASYYREQLPNHAHLVRYLEQVNGSQYGEFLQQFAPEVTATGGRQWQITVPEGNYFVMGDNRDRSADSRFWGFVPEKNLAGKAVYIWMHKMPGLQMPSWSRSGAIE